MLVLVTGHAGFIGYHVARRLLARGDSVVGLDSLDDYYDVRLKEARLAELAGFAGRAGADYSFVRADLAEPGTVADVLAGRRFDRVIHLAAQPGIAFSTMHPERTIRSNVIGFANVLEGVRRAAVPHLTYASTSSVYGASRALPFAEGTPADHPLQLYAATKRSNELMAHSYSQLHGLATTGLRFFTVYGPWGRPDMALYRFAEQIMSGEPIDLYDEGRHTRDFTFIDDIVDGVLAASDHVAGADPNWDSKAPDAASSRAPWRVFNLGSGKPVGLTQYVDALEDALGRKAIRRLLPRRPEDMEDTWADLTRAREILGYRPKTSIREGVAQFAEWYLGYTRRPGDLAHDSRPLLA